MIGRLRSDLAAPLIAAGAFAVFAVMSIVAYVIPAADPSTRETTDYTLLLSEEAARGRKIYQSEGCWYCHTQAVRPVPSDLGLGRLTTADRLAGEHAPAIGMTRIGPDLACAGDRLTDASAITSRLRDPQASYPRSNMPSYRYLSDQELQQLSAYLTSLRCEPQGA